MLSKEREIFKKICNKKLNNKEDLSKKIDFGDLKFTVHSGGLKTDFSETKDSATFLKRIKKRAKLMEEARYKQGIW